jgi:hypothetical protein
MSRHQLLLLVLLSDELTLFLVAVLEGLVVLLSSSLIWYLFVTILTGRTLDSAVMTTRAEMYH